MAILLDPFLNKNEYEWKKQFVGECDTFYNNRCLIDPKFFKSEIQQDFNHRFKKQLDKLQGIRPSIIIIDDLEEEVEQIEVKRSTEMDLQFPRYYIESEGEKYLDWVFGQVNIEAFPQHGIGKPSCIVKGQTVHALVFENPAAGVGNYPCWDTINGWVTTFAAAKIKHFAGKRGEIDARTIVNEEGWIEVE